MGRDASSGWSAALDAESSLSRRPPLRRVLVAAVVAVIIALPAAAYALDRTSAGRLDGGTKIGGVDVGGFTAAEATAALERELVLPLQRPLWVRAPGLNRQTTAWDLGLRLDASRAVDATLRDQRGRALPARVLARFAGADAVALEPSLDEATLRTFLGDVSAQIDRPVREASLDVVDGFLRIRRAQVGRALDVEGAEAALRDALRADGASVDLPVNHVRPSEDGRRFHTAILVHTASNKAYLYEKGELTETYRVATGARGYSTPTGTFRITAKRKNPSWGNPGSAWAANMPRFIGPGPNNPLGTRAMNLSARGIRIHGTPDSASIGTHASHGCIRMLMWEAEELFDRVSVDTPVVIIRA